MLTAFPGNQQPEDGKHVASMDPGAGVRDLSADLARHRDGADARLTVPQGGWPETAGRDPDSPDAGRSPEESLTSASPAAWTQANQFHPRPDY